MAHPDAPSGSVDRRNFLQTGLAAVVGSTVAGSQVAAASTSASEAKQLAKRRFGKKGPELPVLGFGGAALPKAWGNPLSTEERVKLVRYVYDRGIRYFDTAGNYMESESILGQGLKGIRDQVYLNTKVETTEPNQVQKAVEKSLKELQTDYLDGVQIHGTPGLEQMSVEQAMKIHAELVKLREKGLLRFIGFSAHSYFDKALALISSGGFDQCMLSYGYLPRGYNQIYSARMVELRNACVAKAHELGMGLVAMKVIGAGLLGAWSRYVVPGFGKQRLNQLPAAAIRYVLQDQRVHVLTIGMRLKEEVDVNLETFTGDATYTHQDRALLAEYSVKVLASDAMKDMRVD